MNVPATGTTGGSTTATRAIHTARGGGSEATYNWIVNDSSPRGLFQTGFKERMTWLPTDFFQEIRTSTGTTVW